VDTKHLIGLFLIAFGILGGCLAACLSLRVRDAMFFLLVTARVITDQLDVHFVSLEWYRGTTRGFEVSFIDVLAVSLLGGLLLGRRSGRSPRWFWPASLGFMMLYLLYGCFSVAISDPKLFGLFELSKIMRGIVVFLAAALFVRGEREVRLLVLALACCVCLEGAWALHDRYVDHIHRVMGSLEHPNSLSMYLCLTAPVLVAAAASNLPKYLRRFCGLAIVLASVAILLTISRAGVVFFGVVMAGATVACVSPRPTLKKGVAVLLVAVGVVALVAKSWNSLQSRYSEATLAEEEEEGRGLYVLQAREIVQDRFFGVGLNNWSYWVSQSYGAKLGLHYESYDDTDFTHFASNHAGYDSYDSIKYAPPAHGLGALTAGELGLPGLVIFTLVWLRWFQMGATFLWNRSPLAMHQLGAGIFFATCGIFLQSLTEWTYRQTPIFFTFHILLGVLASLYYQKRKSQLPTLGSRISSRLAEIAVGAAAS
jgi:hypothetical protein